MLVLRDRGAPLRLEVAPGVVILARPLRAIDVDLAEMRAARNLADADSGSTALARYGLAADGADSLVALGKRVAATAVAIELGIALICGWEGVGVPTGETGPDGEDVLAPAPVDPVTVAQVLNLPAGVRQTLAEVFIAKLWAASMPHFREKKPSAASPGGAAQAATTTAGSAGIPERAAPPASGTSKDGAAPG